MSSVEVDVLPNGCELKVEVAEGVESIVGVNDDVPFYLPQGKRKCVTHEFQLSHEVEKSVKFQEKIFYGSELE